MTDYVATRWYRAPELILANENYDSKIEIWSLGCIMAELYLRQPFLKGTDWKNQLYLILDTLGNPSDQDTEFIENPNAKKFLRNFPSNSKGKLKQIFQSVDISPEALDLLQKLLRFNPEKRYGVDEAL